jgi:hypothetical protein
MIVAAHFSGRSVTNQALQAMADAFASAVSAWRDAASTSLKAHFRSLRRQPTF